MKESTSVVSVFVPSPASEFMDGDANGQTIYTGNEVLAPCILLLRGWRWHTVLSASS